MNIKWDIDQPPVSPLSAPWIKSPPLSRSSTTSVTERLRERRGCEKVLARQHRKGNCRRRGATLPDRKVLKTRLVSRDRRVHTQQHDYNCANSQACCCYSCHPHDHDMIASKNGGAVLPPSTPLNIPTATVPVQQKDKKLKALFKAPRFLIRSCVLVPTFALWHCRSEHTGTGNRGHVHFGSRRPSRCSCADYQEGPRSKGDRVHQRTASEFHRWCLALFELRLFRGHCYWKVELSRASSAANVAKRVHLFHCSIICI